MTSQRPLALITQQFDGLKRELGKILTGFGYKPMPSSIAAGELASAETAKLLLSAYSQGTILIEVAADQLSAFTRAITEPALTIAPWTNTRSILEAASISVWLLDKHINPQERISRSYAFRYEGLYERIKFACATRDSVKVKEAEKRRDEVLLQAKEFGIVKHDKNGKTILAKPMPSVTTLVRDQLNQEEAYRLLSAMTHAHNWALLELGFRPVSDIPYGKLLGKTLQIESVGYLASIALKAFQKPIMCKCQLFGWPAEDIQTMFDKAWRTLGAIFREFTQ